MSKLVKKYKERISNGLVAGHSKFGRVAARKPYRDDDSGTGESELRFEGHPLLQDQPIGASSDLAFDMTEYRDAQEEAETRALEACPQLQKQPVLQNALSHRFGARPSPL